MNFAKISEAKILKVTIFFVMFWVLSCNSIEKAFVIPKLHEYDKLLDNYSKSTYKYINLFKGKLSAEIIYLSPKIKKALNNDIKNNNLKKSNIPFSIDKSYPTFLLAFYHPDKKLNDFNQKRAIWNIVLKNGKNNNKPSKITKFVKLNHKVFESYFKNNQRFSSFYLVEFSSLDFNELEDKIVLILSSMEATLEVVWKL